MTLEQTIYELETMKTWSKDLSDDEIEALKFALHVLNEKMKEIDTREALQTEPLEVEAAKEQKAYNKGFDDCRRAVIKCLEMYGDKKTLDEVFERVSKLPSVQPELNCKNCVFRTGYGTGIDEGILNALPKKMKEGE